MAPPPSSGDAPSAASVDAPPPAAPIPTENIQAVRRSGPKVGRNDPCPCGSGKKYKVCHGANPGGSTDAAPEGEQGSSPTREG